MEKVRILDRNAHSVSFEYADGSTSYKTVFGSGAHDKNKRRIYCRKGGSMPDISNLTDKEVIEKYAHKPKKLQAENK